MSRDIFKAELGFGINALDGDELVRMLSGAAVPGGDTGIQDDAPIGSIYLRTNGLLYRKIANAGATADWTTDPDLSNLSWREPIKAATNDTLAAGNYDPTAWTDNESAIDHTDFAVDDIVLGDVDGTPILFDVTAVGVGTGSDEITLAVRTPALSENDTHVVRYYLPDSPAAQEGQAIVTYQDSAIAKIGDVNWDLATGINISSGYSATGKQGPVTTSDTVESSIEKLEGDIVDHLAADGLTRGDTNYGTFSAPASLLLTASATAKALFQKIGDLLAQLRGVEVTGVTTVQTIDSVPVASVRACKWLVTVFVTGTPANARSFEVYAMNDGSTAVDDTLYAKLKTGTAPTVTTVVDVDSGDMRLRMTSSASATIRARRIEVIKSVL